MKTFLTLAITALAMGAFATSTFAGGEGCGEGKKDKKDKSEECSS